MGYIVEISEHKLDKATDYAEKMLKYGGMLMQCLTEWEDESGYGERVGSQGGYSRSMMGSRGGSYGSRYGMRSRYDNYGSRGSMGYRDEEEEWEDMGERRRRDSRGRYM